MATERQIEVANSFPSEFKEFEIGLSISKNELDRLIENRTLGKLQIFIQDNFLCFSRGRYCIFKVRIEEKNDTVTLSKCLVNGNKEQYGRIDDEHDKKFILNLIQFVLGRDDLYVDPAFKLESVQKILLKNDPDKRCVRSIGRGNTVSLLRAHYDGWSEERHYNKKMSGWLELRAALEVRSENENLLSLYLQDNQEKSSTTFYFDSKGHQLLGRIVIKTVQKF
jgi:hypothetical protein